MNNIKMVSSQSTVSFTVENATSATLTPQPDGWLVESIKNNVVTIKTGDPSRVTLTINSTESTSTFDIIALNYGLDPQELQEYIDSLRNHYDDVIQYRHHGDYVQETIERMWRELKHLLEVNYTALNASLEMQQSYNELINFLTQSITDLANELIEIQLKESSEKLINELTELYKKEFQEQVDKLHDDFQNQMDEFQDKINQDFKDYTDKIDDLLNSTTDLSNQAIGGISYLDEVFNQGREQGEMDIKNNAIWTITLELTAPGGAQNFWRDNSTGHYYGTQTLKPGIGSTTGATYESVLITHMDSAGRKLDNMLILNGGHGYSGVLFKGQQPLSPRFLMHSDEQNRPNYMFNYMANRTIDVMSSAITPFDLPHQSVNDWFAWVPDTMETVNTRGKLFSMTKLDGGNRLVAYDAVYNPINQGLDIKAESQIIMDFDVPDNAGLDIHQGFTVMRNSDIDGNKKSGDRNKYKAFLFTGQPVNDPMTQARGNAGLYGYDVDLSTKTVTKLTRLNHMEDTVNSHGLESGEWSAYEPEGLFNFAMPTPNRMTDQSAGLGYLLSTGSAGERQHIVFGFLNPTVENTIVASRSLILGANDKLPTSLYPTKLLHQIQLEGEYSFSANQFAKYIDVPKRFRGKSSGRGWTLENKKHNNQGDLEQRLYRHSAGNSLEFIRFIDYTTNNYGDDATKYEVGQWQQVTYSGGSLYAETLPSDITTLSAINETGAEYYVDGARLAQVDVGLAKVSIGGTVRTHNYVIPRISGSDLFRIHQTFDAVDGKHFSRILEFIPDEWGSGGVTPKGSIWHDVNGILIS